MFHMFSAFLVLFFFTLSFLRKHLLASLIFSELPLDEVQILELEGPPKSRLAPPITVISSQVLQSRQLIFPTDLETPQASSQADPLSYSFPPIKIQPTFQDLTNLSHVPLKSLI